MFYFSDITSGNTLSPNREFAKLVFLKSIKGQKDSLLRNNIKNLSLTVARKSRSPRELHLSTNLCNFQALDWYFIFLLVIMSPQLIKIWGSDTREFSNVGCKLGSGRVFWKGLLKKIITLSFYFDDLQKNVHHAGSSQTCAKRRVRNPSLSRDHLVGHPPRPAPKIWKFWKF